jgi:hypothetical protein
MMTLSRWLHAVKSSCTQVHGNLSMWPAKTMTARASAEADFVELGAAYYIYRLLGLGLN